MPAKRFQHKEGRGRLFKNERYDPAKKSPRYKGSCMVNGEDLDIALWKDDDGSLSVKIDKPRESQEPRQQSWKDELDDEIPF